MLQSSLLQAPMSEREKVMTSSQLAISITDQVQAGELSKKEPGFFQSPYLQLVIFLFLADWGDRCQISAVVLTTTYNVYGVAVGGALVIFSFIISIGNGSLCLLSRNFWRLRCRQTKRKGHNLHRWWTISCLCHWIVLYASWSRGNQHGITLK